jgi:hypothetical protein
LFDLDVWPHSRKYKGQAPSYTNMAAAGVAADAEKMAQTVPS